MDNEKLAMFNRATDWLFKQSIESGIAKWRSHATDIKIEHGNSGLIREVCKLLPAHTVSQARKPFHFSYNVFQETPPMLRPAQ
jgi:hypothetical protein